MLRAVRRPVSTGSRQCVNVLKELLPQEVSLAPMHHCLHVGRSIHCAAVQLLTRTVLLLLCADQVLQEIHGQVSSGVKPLQAVEAVTAQRMGPQVWRWPGR